MRRKTAHSQAPPHLQQRDSGQLEQQQLQCGLPGLHSRVVEEAIDRPPADIAITPTVSTTAGKVLAYQLLPKNQQQMTPAKGAC